MGTLTSYEAPAQTPLGNSRASIRGLVLIKGLRDARLQDWGNMDLSALPFLLYTSDAYYNFSTLEHQNLILQGRFNSCDSALGQ